jgi:hypothetical protein
MTGIESRTELQEIADGQGDLPSHRADRPRAGGRGDRLHGRVEARLCGPPPNCVDCNCKEVYAIKKVNTNDVPYGYKSEPSPGVWQKVVNAWAPVYSVNCPARTTGATQDSTPQVKLWTYLNTCPAVCGGVAGTHDNFVDVDTATSDGTMGTGGFGARKACVVTPP